MARRRTVAAGLAMAVPLSLVTVVVTAIPASAAGPGPVARDRAVPTGVAHTRPAKPSTVERTALRRAPVVHWPTAGAADAALPAAGARARAGSLPVAVARPGAAGLATPGRVRVRVLDRAAADRAGVSGLLVQVSRSDGSTATGRASLSVDYSGFGDAFGGDWASRLELVRLPDCALTGATGPHCQPTVLRSTNDQATDTVSADVSVGPNVTTFAVTAGASGPNGDYTATSLSPSATWQVSTQTGDFGWSYPLRTPPVPGGQVPGLSLSYSSGSVDGRTASTDNQPTWVGEGWDLWSGYVQRAFRSCSNDGGSTADLCWGPNDLSVVFDGHATTLVRDDATGTYRLKDDDGSKVEHLTGASNGDNDGEYWRITTTDGTQYYFGRDRLPGWASGDPVTNSAWTVPVFGNGAGEPCHAATFAASSCQQAWRWNLDYVVDPHHSAIAYFYGTETNDYGSDNNAQTASYVRGGYLTFAEYGFTDGNLYAADPPARVAFTVAERCVTPGATCTPTSGNQGNYPDVPLDQSCSATCTASQVAPTFWSTKELTTVTTQILRAGVYSDVDSWSFAHLFPDPGDGTSAALWLDGITHTGLVGGSAADPPVTFDGTGMPNRVDGLEGWPPLNKFRISTIHTETGGQIEVNYAPTDCDAAALPADQATNTARCFAQWWTPTGEPPAMDWFHKYVVAQVLAVDLVGGSPPVETDYDYQGGGAWHYTDADEVAPVAKRTWSQWRGYQKVVVTTGAATDTRSQTSYLYLRGMDGDKLSTGTRSVTVTDSQGGTVTDSPWLAGFLREKITLNGPGGAEVSGQINDPYASAATATHVHDGLTVTSRITGVAGEHGRVDLAAGGVQTTELSRQFDSHGLVTQVDDRGDTATPADDRCTTTSYAADPARGMFSYPDESTTVGVACAATPSYPDDAISDTRTYFDGSATLGALTGPGDATRTDDVTSYTGSTPHFLTTATTTYDALGRPLTVADAMGRTTTTAYTDVGGLTTQTQVTNAAGHVTTSTLEPAWGQPTATVDANAHRVDMTYDPLGRLTAVWKPSLPKATFPDSPAVRFAYLVRTTAPSAVMTTMLGPNGNYTSSYALYDGLLRPRQTQSPAEGGGRILADTVYDSRGLVAKTNAGYFNPADPGTTLATVDDNEVPAQTLDAYDGAGRITDSIFRSLGVEQWRTRTGYGGDRVSVTPPAGGTPSTTITDARGRTTELRQYHAGTPSGAFDATTYAYTKAGELATLTDPAGNAWSYTYDVRGRQVSSVDPDKGSSMMTYDDDGELLTSTDARGQTLAYTYDVLGRKTGEFDGSPTGTQMAKWVYDTKAKGLPTSETRFVDGHAYTSTVLGYTPDGQPTASIVSIPTNEGALAGNYLYAMHYADDGQPTEIDLPATGGLPNESVTYRYDDLGNPTTLESGLPGGVKNLVTGAVYTQLGKPARFTLSNGGVSTFLSYSYQESTQRLTGSKVELGGNPVPVSDASYTYDPAGNLTKSTDTVSGGTADTQCFGYDNLRRLTQAWTATDDCVAAPSASVLGGPAPYWQSFAYDSTGNRLTATRHDTTGTGDDTTDTYAYPAAGQSHPHAPTSVTTTTGTVSATSNFGYDAIGDTTARPQDGNAQALTWDAEGNLASVTQAGATTSYLYDPDGVRLISRDASGSTLFLPDGIELHADSSGVKSSTRYYSFDGQTVAVRTGSGLAFLGSDPHGTSTQAVDATTGAVSTRLFDPFGNPRGTPPASFPGDHGFVGGVADPTGLTHLGAREYDPAAGRFLSVDPVLDAGDPQSLNGYGYADDNPTTFTDPTGQICNNGPDGTCHKSDGTNVPTGGVSGPGGLASGDVAGSHPGHTSSGSSDEERARAANVSVAQLHKAQAVKKKSVVDVIVHAGGELLSEFLGINDIKGCFTHGDIGSCVSLVANAIPWYRIAKAIGLIKVLHKAYEAFKLFVKESRWADRILRKVKDAAESCVVRNRNSFTPATQVLTPGGDHKAIKDLRPGDKVLATDPATGRTVARTVVATIVGTGIKHLITVTVDTDGPGGDQIGQVTATDGHPFFVVSPHPAAGPNLANGVWTLARDLHPGDLLRTPAGTTVTVLALTTTTATQTVYNLTVDTDHTYNVDAGDTPVLVHNDGSYVQPPKNLPGFPTARRVQRKTPVQGGGGMRARWEDRKYIYEWDSQHGEIEKYSKNGKHLGAFDPESGDPIAGKGPVSGRTCVR